MTGVLIKRAHFGHRDRHVNGRQCEDTERTPSTSQGTLEVTRSWQRHDIDALSQPSGGTSPAHTLIPDF